MNKIVLLALSALVVLPHYASAQAGGAMGPNSLQDEVKQLAELGPGVQGVKKENGALKSLKVVGVARISTVLGVSKGLIDARRNARLNAQKEFIKWVKTEAKAVEYSDSETKIMLEGQEQNGAGSHTESAKGTETSAEAIGAAAEGAIRGLQVLGEVRSGGDENSLSVIVGWSAENAVLAGKAGATNEADYSGGDGSGAPNTGVAPADGSGPADSSAPVKTIEPKASASKDLADF